MFLRVCHFPIVELGANVTDWKYEIVAFKFHKKIRVPNEFKLTLLAHEYCDIMRMQMQIEMVELIV